MKYFIIELEPNVWAANWDGDPGRTLKEESAKIFYSECGALHFLGYLRAENPQRKFACSKIIEKE